MRTTVPTLLHFVKLRTIRDAPVAGRTTESGRSGSRMRSRGWTKGLTGGERARLAGLGAAVAGLHVAGWALFVWYSRGNPALAGLGTLAYAFGLRHAFDADHIAAIDNTTRKFLQDGKRPLGVGFFFSLGHST